MITHLELEKALPPALKGAVNQGLLDLVNNINNDPLFCEHYRENFISYTSVMKEGKFKLEDYIKAVQYVSYKLMNHSNHDAYVKTFPQRYSDLVAKGASAKDISSYVSAYSRGKLVNLIMEQSLVPVWVVNQDNYQRAINVQVELMTTASSEKVRCDAANSILTHLQKPKEAASAITINTGETSGLNELRDAMKKLVHEQLKSIESGSTAKNIAASPLIIDAEIVDGSEG